MHANFNGPCILTHFRFSPRAASIAAVSRLVYNSYEPFPPQRATATWASRYPTRGYVEGSDRRQPADSVPLPSLQSTARPAIRCGRGHRGAAARVHAPGAPCCGARPEASSRSHSCRRCRRTARSPARARRSRYPCVRTVFRCRAEWRPLSIQYRLAAIRVMCAEALLSQCLRIQLEVAIILSMYYYSLSS